MRLIHRSAQARDAVSHTHGGGEVFVVSVLICMLLAVLGDAIDPALFGEAGLDIAFLDFGADSLLLGAAEWPLLSLLFAGGVLALAYRASRGFGTVAMRVLRQADARRDGKVPI